MMPSRPGERDGVRPGQLPSGTSPGQRGYVTGFLKRYRTEVAASASSVLSTFTTVRAPQISIAKQLLTSLVPPGLGEDTHADVQVQELLFVRSAYLPNGEAPRFLSRRYSSAGKRYSSSYNIFFGLSAVKICVCIMGRAQHRNQSSHPCQYPWNISNIRDGCLFWRRWSNRRILHHTSSM